MRSVAKKTGRKCEIEESNMKLESVTVELRLSTKPDSKVKAFADVTIPLGDDGTITVLGTTLRARGGTL